MKLPDDNDVVRANGRSGFDPLGGLVPFVLEAEKPATPKREEAKESAMAVRLVGLVDADDLVVDERGDAYAHLLQDGHRELHRVRSRGFRSWLAGEMYDAEERAPNGEALSSALNVLEARARRGQRVTLWNRVARGDDGATWIDLADKQWRAVRVTSRGWELRHDPPPLFRRYSHQQPLPRPVPGGSAHKLLRFLNVASEDDGLLFLASTVAALVPNIPQAMLILHGPQGSAKTTAARVRRALVDPSAVPTVIVRRDLGELVQALDHHYMPLLDNLNTLSDWQSDIFCQAATGGGFCKRELYSDADDVILSFRRPLVLTGINVPAVAPDLLDRAMLIRLERIAPDRRQDETYFWQQFDAARPEIFGGLLDALVNAMQIESTLSLGRLPRLADFARWGAAAAEALGFGAGAFIKAMFANVERQLEEVVEYDPVAHAVVELARAERQWSGSASELYEVLAKARGNNTAEAGWPKRSADLGRRLNVLRSTLADLGVQVEPSRHGGGDRRRTWTITCHS